MRRRGALPGTDDCIELSVLQEVSKVLGILHELIEECEPLFSICGWPERSIRPLCKEAPLAPTVTDVVRCFVHAAATLKLGVSPSVKLPFVRIFDVHDCLQQNKY